MIQFFFFFSPNSTWTDFCNINAMQVTDISVPQVIDFRKNATLSCSYNIGTHALNSVKWYKDGMEFFRWVFVWQEDHHKASSNEIERNNAWLKMTIIACGKWIRYAPMMTPRYMNFKVDGVQTVEPTNSCNTYRCSVTLVRLSPSSSGTYRCEVSGDAPEFKVAIEVANMTVAGNKWIIPHVLSHKREKRNHNK